MGHHLEGLRRAVGHAVLFFFSDLGRHHDLEAFLGAVAEDFRLPSCDLGRHVHVFLLVFPGVMEERWDVLCIFLHVLEPPHIICGSLIHRELRHVL